MESALDEDRTLRTVEPLVTEEAVFRHKKFFSDNSKSRFLRLLTSYALSTGTL